MKILFIVDYYQPQLGYGSYWINREFAKMGHEVLILTSNYYYPFPNYESTAGTILGGRELKPGCYESEGVKVIREKMFFEIFTRAIFFNHKKYIQEFNPDIVFVDKTVSFNTLVACVLKRRFGYKLVSIDAHLPSGFFATGNVPLKRFFYFIFRLLFSNFVNNSVDKFIAVQEGTLSIMRKYYGIRKHIVHIPLGTDPYIYHFDRRSRQMIRKHFNISPREFVIIYTGKIIKEKGVHILFKAFNILKRKGVRCKLMLVGSAADEYRNYCLSFLEKNYIDDVIWVGFKKAIELYKYYSAADVGVWPLQESMSMNDAASCELPFIANDRIGVKLRVSNDNALLYRKGSPRDLAEKILYLYKNPRIRKQMGKRGRELVLRSLSWRKIAENYLDLPC